MKPAKYVVELIGMFFIVLTIGMVVLTPLPEAWGHLATAIKVIYPPIAIGMAFTVMIYAGGHVSGGHYNPGVTLAVLIRGKISPQDAGLYIVAQLAGAALASFVVMFLTGREGSDTALMAGRKVILVGEFLFAFALAWVVLNVATAKANAGNSFYGLAIGGIIMVGAFAVGPLTGGAFNPAVATGLTLMKLVPMEQIWMHIAANFAGGAAAGGLFKLLIKD